MLSVFSPFHAVAAFFEDMLWQHPKMSDKRNAPAHDRFYLWNYLTATFRFDGFRAGGLQALRVFDGVSDRLIAVIRKVRREQGLWRGARGCSNVMLHLLHRD